MVPQETKAIGVAQMSEARLVKSSKAHSKRSYRARVERRGIERIREIARQNGKQGGRPPKKGERK